MRRRCWNKPKKQKKMSTMSRRSARLAHWLASSMSCTVYVFCHLHHHHHHYRHILCGAMNVTIIILCQYLETVIHHHLFCFSKYITNIISIWICHLVYIIPSCVPVCSIMIQIIYHTLRKLCELYIINRHLNS